MELNRPELTIDDDVVEEEILVHADFDSVLDDGMFQHSSLLKVIGLETEEPFLQIGTQVYSGKWSDTVGTHLFFEPEEAPPPVDPIFSDVPQNLLSFKFKTRKVLELSRVFINPKQDDESAENKDVGTSIDNKATESPMDVDNISVGIDQNNESGKNQGNGKDHQLS